MHDRNGNPLKVGDKVNVPCTIVSLGNPAEDYCNINLVTDVPMGTRTVGDSITLNAKQTELVESAERPPVV